METVLQTLSFIGYHGAILLPFFAVYAGLKNRWRLFFIVLLILGACVAALWICWQAVAESHPGMGGGKFGAGVLMIGLMFLASGALSIVVFGISSLFGRRRYD